MASLCEGDNEPVGSLKVICNSLKFFALEGSKGTGFICVGLKSFSCDTSIAVFQMLKETNDADYEIQAENTPHVSTAFLSKHRILFQFHDLLQERLGKLLN
ncbi:hypothetical protein ANN_01296 [Periplaneta americana]|uniref:Uncharacterized protein n=1 Tax=Periplaneta americana TaxID=6978 RepID=A0ABQ8TT72_PERAM|nr:hypothetical protein ANN_01296 [Periplaneta americana]